MQIYDIFLVQMYCVLCNYVFVLLSLALLYALNIFCLIDTDYMYLELCVKELKDNV